MIVAAFPDNAGLIKIEICLLFLAKFPKTFMFVNKGDQKTLNHEKKRKLRNSNSYKKYLSFYLLSVNLLQYDAYFSLYCPY